MKMLKWISRVFSKKYTITGYLAIPKYVKRDLLKTTIDNYNKKEYFFVCKYNKSPSLYVNFNEIIGRIINIPLIITKTGKIKIEMELLNTVFGKVIKKIIKSKKDIKIKFLPVGTYNKTDVIISYVQLKIDFNEK